jgi:hypothetical protein
MTAPARLADAQRTRAQRLARSVADRLQERWALIDSSDITASWATLLAGAVRVVAAGQALAAIQAEEYVTAVTNTAASAALNPAGFAGTAADGRDLATLLTLPVITAKTAIAAGQPVSDALSRGAAQLLMFSTTEVTDAGRLATGAAITARPKAYGHVRVVSPPACGRCIVLSGRVYRWSEGFQRHPRCDCSMQPVASAEAKAARSPGDLFRDMDSSEQEKAFTVAGAKAIRDGADIGQVVNSRRGMYEAGGRSFTTEGTTRRGLAGKQLEAAGSSVRNVPGERVRRVTVPRLTPKQIYVEAGEDRGEAIRLLRRFGYLTG